MNTEFLRRLENIVRLGVVDSVDYDKALCIVDFQGILTCPLPWLTLRAGTDSTWDSPSKGEQCVVLAPSGELVNGIVLLGLYSNTNPAPETNQNIKSRKFSDGAVIQYNTETHHLEATLPDGGTANIKANVVIDGTLHVTETITADQDISTPADVKAGDISLTKHKTSGVKSGPDTSGGPVP